MYGIDANPAGCHGELNRYSFVAAILVNKPATPIFSVIWAFGPCFTANRGENVTQFLVLHNSVGYIFLGDV